MLLYLAAAAHFHYVTYWLDCTTCVRCGIVYGHLQIVHERGAMSYAGIVEWDVFGYVHRTITKEIGHGNNALVGITF